MSPGSFQGRVPPVGEVRHGVQGASGPTRSLLVHTSPTMRSAAQTCTLPMPSWRVAATTIWNVALAGSPSRRFPDAAPQANERGSRTAACLAVAHFSERMVYRMRGRRRCKSGITCASGDLHPLDLKVARHFTGTGRALEGPCIVGLFWGIVNLSAPPACRSLNYESQLG